MRYAERTEVSSEKSKAEIERLLTRYGATSFASGWSSATETAGWISRESLND